MKVEKREMKLNVGSREVRMFHYFITKAQNIDKKVLQTNINLAARSACEVKDSTAIDLVVKQVVQISTKAKGFVEIAIYLTDSIMRHAARCQVAGVLERYQKRLKPHLRNLFKRALRRQGKREDKDRLITRLKDKVLAKWKKEKWFDSELQKVSDIIQIAVKENEDLTQDEILSDDEAAMEVKEEPKGLAYSGVVPATPGGFLKVKAKAAAYSGVTPKTPAIGKAKAASAQQTPFMGTAKAAPFSSSPDKVQSVPFSAAITMKEEQPQVPAKSRGMLIPRTSAPVGKAISRTSSAPAGIPRTPVQIGIPGSPRLPTMGGIPRTPAQIKGGLPRTPASIPVGLPRTPKPGLPSTPKPGAVPLSPQSSLDFEPEPKRQRLNPGLPSSPRLNPGLPSSPRISQLPGSPEILQSLPKTPPKNSVLIPGSPPEILRSVPVTPKPGAVPQTPVPGIPKVGAVPQTPNIGAMPRTPAFGAVPQTPKGGMLGGSSAGAVPSTPRPTANAAAVPTAGAVPDTPSTAAPAGVGAVPNTPSTAKPSGSVPHTPKAGARLGSVPQSPPALPQSPPFGSVPQSPPFGAIPRTPGGGFVPKAPPFGFVPVKGKSGAFLTTKAPSSGPPAADHTTSKASAPKPEAVMTIED